MKFRLLHVVLLGVSLLTGWARAETATLRIATFDSGFGGFLTAKAIEAASPDLLKRYDVQFSIRHYGDTANAPYGIRPPSEIAELSIAGIRRALDHGADIVFIACNTASTEEPAIRAGIEQSHPGRGKDLMFIISASVQEAKRQLDHALGQHAVARLLVLATPATGKAQAYPRSLAAAYGQSLQTADAQTVTQPRWSNVTPTIDSRTQTHRIDLAGGKAVEIVQVSPANWVELVERGGSLKEKHDAVKNDVTQLAAPLGQGADYDVVGYFCTHYPILDGNIRSALNDANAADANTGFISQGGLMAREFVRWAEQKLQGRERKTPISETELAQRIAAGRASIEVTGDNADVTAKLARSIYPKDPDPVITTWMEGVKKNAEKDAGKASTR